MAGVAAGSTPKEEARRNQVAGLQQKEILVDTEPLTDEDRLLAVIRILLEAMLTALDAPGTEMDEDVADQLASELRVADAMLPKPVKS
jgi:hypothetical protein